MPLRLYWDEQFPLLTLRGKGARDFLHGQTSANVLAAEEGKIFLSCWLNTKGKVRAILEIKIGQDCASIIILAGKKEEVFRGFESVIFPSDKVSLEEGNMLRRLHLIDGDSSNSKDKIVWIMSNENLPNNFGKFSQASQREIDNWRISKVLPISSSEIDGNTNPFELGLKNLVSLDKGCYLGQESIAKLSRLPNSKRKLITWRSEFKISEGNFLRDFSEGSSIGKKVGTVTFSIPLKDSNGSWGLALVNTNSLNSNFCVSDPFREVKINNSEISLRDWLE